KMEVAEGVREMPADHHPAPRAASKPASRSTSARSAPPVPQAAPTPPPAVTGAAVELAPPPLTETVGEPSNRRGPVRAAGNIPVPPRTKRYLKEKGIFEFTHQIVAAGTKLMPADVDKFLAEGGPREEPKPAPADYDETTLPNAQQTLNYRMARGAQVALPAVLETTIEWKAIAAARDITREQGGATGFAMLLWCVADAMKHHERFRSTLSTDGKTLRTYHHVNLGVAVSLPGDKLVTAVVRNADTLERDEFFDTLSERIAEARDGKDQIDGKTTVSVSNIGTAGMRSGIPVVVTPAVATIAIGEVRDEPVPAADGFTFRKVATLTMSFDHRLVNGVGAANFLNDVRQRAAEFSL
ncbi:MAG: 2-oxo acid dehydrogenase subunit E2, partial [Planctomycetota bacterium]